MSLFKRKKGPAHLDVTPAASFQPALAPSSSLAPRRAVSGSSVPSTPTSPYDSHVHIDDFGRPVAGPAFAAQQGAGGAPFGSGHGVGDDEPVGEMQLLYGYAPIATTLELSIIKVEKIVAACAVELQRRGLSSRLLCMWGGIRSLCLDRPRHASHTFEHGARHLARRRHLAHPRLSRRSLSVDLRFVESLSFLRDCRQPL